VIGGYQASLDQVIAQLDALSASLPDIVRMVSFGLTAFLVWMAIAQLGLFTQGWELLTENKQGEEEKEEEKIEEVKEAESEPEKVADEAGVPAEPEEDKPES
jgi:hypothetical protein